MADEKSQNFNKPSSDEVTEGSEETTVSVPKEEYDKLVGERATLVQDKAGLVDEIKDVRQKKQEAEEERDKLQTKLDGSVTPPEKSDEITPDSVVKAAKDAATKAANAAMATVKKEDFEQLKTDMINEFKNSHPEFKEDNDAGGIKYVAFEKKLEMFNLDSTTTKEKISEILNSAYNLLTGNKSQVENNQTPPSSTPQNPGGGGPTSTNPDNLSSKEKEIVRDTYGGDTEKYLKMKAKHPDYVAELLQWKR